MRDVERPADPIERAVAPLADVNARVVLAVSGGVDSMVLLHVAASLPTLRARLVVATFDHGTGPHAAAAANLVERTCLALGVRIRRGRAALGEASEAAWREARWRFLSRVARAEHARIATAHTHDDQVETVVLRILRGAGARGLAALYAQSDLLRPLLAVRRADVEAYARGHAVEFLTDPSNASRRYLRNRVRLDLIPALERARPGFAKEMIDVAWTAAAWRREVETIVGHFVAGGRDGGALRVARAELATYDADVLRVVWPAIAARARVTLDRRGTRRLAQFTIEAASGRRMQLSGGAEVVRRGGELVLRQSPLVSSPTDDHPLSGELSFGGWRFRQVARGAAPTVWAADLPADRTLRVRAWRPGDRMRADGTHAARRVKRFFADARIVGPERVGWPVVLADEQIVWIPGVRRSDAAAVRSGGPVVRYACERLDG